MDIFLDAFFSIDTNNREIITSEELKIYMEKNNFEPDFVEKWLKLFDKDRNGTITLSEYCKALGLLTKKARLYRNQSFPKPKESSETLSVTKGPNNENSLRPSFGHQSLSSKDTFPLKLDSRILPDIPLSPVSSPTSGIPGTLTTFPQPLEIYVIKSDASEELFQEVTQVAKEEILNKNSGRQMARNLKEILDHRYGHKWQVFVVLGNYWMNYSHDAGTTIFFKIGSYIFLIWKTSC